MKKCSICNGTGIILKQGDEWECYNCDGYGVIFIDIEQNWNPWKKQEMANIFLKKEIYTKESYKEDFPEDARARRFDGGF